MTAKLFHLPVKDRKRTSVEDARLDAATEWLLSEIDEPLSITALRSLAGKEFIRPRDGIHYLWAKAFLEETEAYENPTTVDTG